MDSTITANNMPITLNHSFFADKDVQTGNKEEGAKDRPKLPSMASHASVIASPTVAVSMTPIDSKVIIDTRDDLESTPSHAGTNSRAPTLNSEAGYATSADVSRSDTDKLTWIEADEDQYASMTEDELNDLNQEDQLKYFLSRQRHFMILSSAGKPIYSRYGTEQIIAGYMGIIQAIMGFYQDATNPDVLRSFRAQTFQATVIVKGPVYLVSFSRRGESDDVLRSQLEFLYDVVVSSVTSTSMKRLFERGSNFDLRRLLSGTEIFMNRVCDNLDAGSLRLGVLLNSLAIFRLRYTLRKKINDILAAKRPKSGFLLYGLIAIDKKLVSIIRPKAHSLYPSDLRLLFEAVYTRGFQEGQDFWFPLCLPKFNDTGFLHVFVSFIASGTAVILLSTDKDAFFELQEMKVELLRKLEKERLNRDLVKARHTQITLGDLGIADVVDHFTFKSKSRLQYLAPDSYGVLDFKFLMHLYASMQATSSLRHKYRISQFTHKMSNADGQEVDAEIVGLSWVTQSFELIVVGKPSLSSTQERIPKLIGAANVIHQFVKREESRLWVDDGVTF